MSAKHAAAGDVLTLVPQGDELRSGTLIRETHAEVFRLVMKQGKHLAEHSAAGAITVQCLSGRVDMVALGKTQAMPAGTLIHLAEREPHAVTAIEDSVLLVSMWLHRT